MTPPNDSGQPPQWMRDAANSILTSLELEFGALIHKDEDVIAIIAKHAPALPVSRKEEKTERSPEVKVALAAADGLPNVVNYMDPFDVAKTLAAEVRRLESHSREQRELNQQLEKSCSQLAQERDTWKTMAEKLDAKCIHEQGEGWKLLERTRELSAQLTAATKDAEKYSQELVQAREKIESINKALAPIGFIAHWQDVDALVRFFQHTLALFPGAQTFTDVETQLSAAHKTAEGLREALRATRGDIITIQKLFIEDKHTQAYGYVVNQIANIDYALARSLPQSSASSTTEAREEK